MTCSEPCSVAISRVVELVGDAHLLLSEALVGRGRYSAKKSMSWAVANLLRTTDRWEPLVGLYLSPFELQLLLCLLQSILELN